MSSFNPNFSFSFIFMKKLFTFSSFFAIGLISSKRLRLLIFLPAILIHACSPSRLAFSMLYTTYEQWMEFCDIVKGTGTKTNPKKKKSERAKQLSERSLQRAVKRREAKSKGEKERYKHLNAEFQRIARRLKKVVLKDQCKEIEENNRLGKARISSRRL